MGPYVRHNRVARGGKRSSVLFSLDSSFLKGFYPPVLHSTASQKTTWSVEFSTEHQVVSTAGYGPPYNDPSLLIDGIFSDPNSVSGLRSSLFYIRYGKDYPWIEVNLGANHTVSGVILHNRRDCCNAAYQNSALTGRFDVSADSISRVYVIARGD